MKQILLRGGLPLLAMVTLTGCFDDNYDLSDIDTTTEIKVKDLVLPFNLDPVTLSDIIEIKDDEQIKEITLNGQTFYAVQESGTFKSDPINIPGFHTDAPSLEQAKLEFKLGNASHMAAHAPANSITLGISSPVEKEVTYSAQNIDAAIVEINDLFTDNLSIALDFTASAEVTGLADVELTDLTLSIPQGLTIEKIIPENGIYKDGHLFIPSLKLEAGKALLSLKASAINLPANNSGIDYANHSLNLSTKVDIESANLVVTSKSDATVALPNEVSLDINYTISPLDVTAVSGKIRYELEGDALNISPISLSSIPDFLAGDGTNLILSNPQIYLSVNNPVADEHLGFQTGLQLTAIRDNNAGKTFSLDNGYFRVGYDNGVAGPYNFCLSPSMPANVPETFANPQHIPFSDLGYVISGNGIPQSIDIELVDPQVYEQDVTAFALNQNLDALSGKWEFLAPLAMAEGTDAKIIYTKTVDGWNDDDVDAITIQTLEVSMNVTNGTPLAAYLTGYPIDKSGNQISDVTIEGADIPGNAQNAEVKLHITGEVKHLDGITFTATVTPAKGEALSPNQSITLSNIKAKVSGDYTKEL